MECDQIMGLARIYTMKIDTQIHFSMYRYTDTEFRFIDLLTLVLKAELLSQKKNCFSYFSFKEPKKFY